MKLLSFGLLMAIMVFVVSGCSDDPGPIASPTGQIANGPGSLAKNIQREFTATTYPTAVIDPGWTKTPDGKMIVRGWVQATVVKATFRDGGIDLLSGTGVLELNGTADFNKGVGEFWGNLTLTPLAPQAQGGVWKMTWHGKGTLGPSGWTIPLKQIGHGSGGALTGMQCFCDNMITGTASFSFWTGAVEGYIKVH